MTPTKRRDDGRAFDIGDLVELEGDVTGVYRVDSYAKIMESNGEEYYQYEIVYCGQLENGWEYWIDIAIECELTLVARAADAEIYLRMGQRLQTASQPLSIDDLLDDLWSLMQLRDSFAEGSAVHEMIGEMIEEVKERLGEATE